MNDIVIPYRMTDRVFTKLMDHKCETTRCRKDGLISNLTNNQERGGVT